MHNKTNRTRVTTGVWGGKHSRLQLTDRGGEIEYDCAHGTLSEPLEVDGQNQFRVRGTYVREQFGPIRVGFTPAVQPALYTGFVSGDSLTLTVTLTDEQIAVGTFELTRGSEGRLWKCK